MTGAPPYLKDHYSGIELTPTLVPPTEKIPLFPFFTKMGTSVVYIQGGGGRLGSQQFHRTCPELVDLKHPQKFGCSMGMPQRVRWANDHAAAQLWA